MKTMQFDYVPEIAQGAVARSEARLILKFLDDRGIEVSPADRGRIESCTDLEALEHWLMQAPYVGGVDELFAD